MNAIKLEWTDETPKLNFSSKLSGTDYQYTKAFISLNLTIHHTDKVLTPSPVGICPLMLSVRKGEWVDKRLSHSLGRGSGTDSMKFFFSSLMLAWCFLISSWLLSKSYSWKDKDAKQWILREKTTPMEAHRILWALVENNSTSSIDVINP